MQGIHPLFAWKVPHEGPADMAEPHTGSQSGFRLIPLKGDVRFDQVVFGYTPEKTILNGISLYAKPGQKIRLWVPPAPERPPSSIW